MSESTSTLDRPADHGTDKARKGKYTGNFAHRLYTGEFEFNFVARRKLWYSISIVLIVISLAALLVRGLNLGIEFKGGSVFTVPGHRRRHRHGARAGAQPVHRRGHPDA